MKLLPVQIILVIIGGVNAIIDNTFAGPLTDELSSYIRGFALGLPFYCIGTQFTAFLQLEHQEKRSYVSIVSMFVANPLFTGFLWPYSIWGSSDLGFPHLSATF